VQLRRVRLKAAIGALFAATLPAAAHADPNAPTQIDASMLYYGEKARTTVLEPVVKVTRLFGAQAMLYGQAGFDAISGASPTGAAPSTTIQTTTSASGRTTTNGVGSVPTARFNDHRFLGELGGKVPLGLGFALGASGHVSTERDYQSRGGTATLTLECLQKTTTFTGGYGINHDTVNPKGGTPVGLETVGLGTGEYTGVIVNPKRVTSVGVGVSRILSRRWMVAVNASHDQERGYLTEPYKVLTVADPTTGDPTGTLLHESRPDARDRKDVLASSVYHFAHDVLYTSYRYYWDDWGVRSSTFDLKYRINVADHAYLQPHVRYYTQTAATFYRAELVQGDPVPAFASADERLGVLHTTSYGLTWGLPVHDRPGQFFVRGEYLRQTGAKSFSPVAFAGGDFARLGTTAAVVGPVTELPRPPLCIGTVLIGYSTSF